MGRWAVAYLWGLWRAPKKKKKRERERKIKEGINKEGKKERKKRKEGWTRK